jgi:hypothetical protein
MRGEEAGVWKEEKQNYDVVINEVKEKSMKSKIHLQEGRAGV